MEFEITNDIQHADKPKRRGRGPSKLYIALDKLEVGQGFYFMDKRLMKNLYPVVSPKRFGGKRFQISIVEFGEDGMNKVAVSRVE